MTIIGRKSYARYCSSGKKIVIFKLTILVKRFSYILPMRTSLFWHSWPGPISVPSFFACSNLFIPPPNHLLQLSQGKLLTKLGGRWKLRLDISTIIPLDHPAVISLKYDNLLKKRILKCKSGQINDIWHVKWRVWKSERRCSLKFSGRWYL